ncbi:hypothetical protein [Brevundimonas sp. TWP1-2-1b1]|uniref:hypothetical protein n=1 Tax=unclassified Brevundimonas TaxID=2622653 RepID=UPI003CE92DC6
MNAEEKLAKLYETEIANAASHANDAAKRWLGTLGIGNGAALLGYATLSAPKDNTILLYQLIPSMWLFLLGVTAAFAAFGFIGSAWRHDENSWRYSEANNTWENLKQPENVDEKIVESEDKKAEQSRRWAAYLTISSCMTFLIGVGYPLFRLIITVMHGDL